MFQSLLKTTSVFIGNIDKVLLITLRLLSSIGQNIEEKFWELVDNTL